MALRDLSFEEGVKYFGGDKGRYREHLIYRIMLKLNYLQDENNRFFTQKIKFIESIPGSEDAYLYTVANLYKSKLEKFIENIELTEEEEMELEIEEQNNREN